MKNLQVILFLTFSVMMTSCDKDDDNANAPVEGTSFQATINGGAYSNYAYELGVYKVTKGTNGNTISIAIGDINGEQITLFLNGTGGFSNGTVKQMGDIDSSNFVTYGLFRQKQPQISYYSSTGSTTITENRTHPTVSGRRLISGTFNIKTSSVDNSTELTMVGAFNELEYDE